MCGINGIVQYSKKYSSEEMYNIVHDMNERIIHRGPDSEGIYCDDICALGMRRLAIIDLQTGKQPIWNKAHTLMIVFNGELYNYIELKQSLIKCGCIFQTASDTEVVLKGYETSGCSFFNEMEGMFAFSIYDATQKHWIFARDRIGEKPLYYYCGKDYFVFGSELKSLLTTGLIPRVIDTESLSQYFQLTYIPAPKCIIKNVKKMQPATYMILNADGELTSKTYWKLNIKEEENKDYNHCKKLLRNALFEAVEKRMVSDVPLGAFLSGGIDSTIIVGIMSAISQNPVNTFNIGFKDKQYDESDLAKLVAEKNHTNHHVIYADLDDIFDDIDSVLNNIDEPFADPSLIVTHSVSRLTRQYVKVALTGDAGDELFAGYDKYLISYYSNLYNKVPRIIRNGIAEPLAKHLPVDSYIARKINKVLANADKSPYLQRKELLSLGFDADAVKLLLPDLEVDEMKFIRKYYDALAKQDDQTRAQYVDMKILLEGCMLAKVDRASMLASLETRVPMLDSKVIELAFNFPTRYKINGKKRKIILKETFADMIPAKLYQSPKRGFNVPVGKWLRNELKGRLTEFINSDFLNEQGLFNPGYIETTIENHIKGFLNMERQVWAYFVFQYWYKNVFLLACDYRGGGYDLSKAYEYICEIFRLFRLILYIRQIQLLLPQRGSQAW